MQKANALSERLFTIMEENLLYYTSLESRFAKQLEQEMAITHAVMGRLASESAKADSTFGATLEARFSDAEEAYQGTLMQIGTEGQRRTSKVRF